MIFVLHLHTQTFMSKTAVPALYTTALVSVFTAVFIGCGSVVIHIAVCVYQSKHRKKSVKVQANSTGNGDTTNIEVIYEEVQHKKEGGEVIKMEENQAYSPPPWMR